MFSLTENFQPLCCTPDITLHKELTESLNPGPRAPLSSAWSQEEIYHPSYITQDRISVNSVVIEP